MANTSNVFGAFLIEGHANFFCSFKRNNLADIVKQRCKNEFVTGA
jgi:hypothetical protein